MSDIRTRKESARNLGFSIVLTRQMRAHGDYSTPAMDSPKDGASSKPLNLIAETSLPFGGYTVGFLEKSSAGIRGRALRDTWKRARRLNGVLNAFIRLNNPSRPRLAGPLQGIGVAVKDNFYTRGVPTTGGSKILARFVPDYDATAVRKLKEAGAVIIGKTNTHEFALGSTNINPQYGWVRNPFDTSRISGGSSGGSAVAVASGMSTAALGSDTGGSVRIPAALCGVVGFKPSFGAVSKHGVIPLSWSFDHVGFLTRGVEDSRILFELLCGYDALDDSTRLYRPTGKLHKKLDGTIFGISDYFLEDMDAALLARFNDSLRTLERSGAIISKSRLPSVSSTPYVYDIITSCEAASYHLRYFKNHRRVYGEDVRRRIEVGMKYKASNYLLAQRARNRIAREFATIFEEVDALLTPTVPIVAPNYQEARANPRLGRRLLRNTQAMNLTGQPALTLFNGFVGGMPSGLQLCAPYGSDRYLLGLASDIEKRLARRS